MTITADSPALTAHELARTFHHPSGPIRVLQSVDLTVHPGEIVTISGPSGSGKSALIAILCGFDQPDSGTVHIHGHPLAGPPHWHDCAVLPQAMGLATELTLAENIALPLRLAGHAHPHQRALQLLDELDIDHLADRYPTETSYGQQQRAALARAIATNPTVLLADEPTAHLDHNSTPLVLTALRQCANTGTAILIATHDPRVHAIANRTLTLTNGTLTSQGN